MVKFIQEQYPPGTRIRLNSMNDPYAPITPGTEGVVDLVDDDGQLHMKWDNGRTLAIIPWRGQLHGAAAQAGNAEALCAADRRSL